MRILLALPLALASFAFAQTTDPLPDFTFDVSLWFRDVTYLAAVVFSITALVKGRFALHGLATLGVSFASGIVIAFLFSLTPWYVATAQEAFSYGVAAAILASGGREGIIHLIQTMFVWRVPPATSSNLPPHDPANPIPPSRRG